MEILIEKFTSGRKILDADGRVENEFGNQIVRTRRPAPKDAD